MSRFIVSKHLLTPIRDYWQVKFRQQLNGQRKDQRPQDLTNVQFPIPNSYRMGIEHWELNIGQIPWFGYSTRAARWSRPFWCSTAAVARPAAFVSNESWASTTFRK